MTTDKFDLKGSLKLEVFDEDGKLKQTQEVKNLIVTAGKNFVCSRLKDNTSAAPGYIAVGTDSTAASAGQTALITEIARAAVTSATVSTNTIAYVVSFAAGVATGTLVEAGIFNDASAGTMLSRTASISVVKGASDSLTITWTITVS